MTNSPIARRHFLKAAGVSIALPALESLGQDSTPHAPKRMVCVCSAVGMHPQSFFPNSYGRDYQLSPVLSPLSEVRQDLTVFSHMDHPTIFTKHGGKNSLLSGIDARKAKKGENVSIDQVAAAHVGYQTRFPSVHISLGGKQGSSWSPTGINVREEAEPLELFQKLFVNDSADAKRAAGVELAQQGSVLDLVREQARRLGNSVTQSDGEKLDEYLTAVREAEERIQGMQRWQEVPKPEVTPEGGVSAHGKMNYPALSPLMFDLLFLAIQSDTSRVFTAGFGLHNHVIEIPGVTHGYHGLTHHGNLPDRLAQLQLIETFYMAQMARFIARLKASPTQAGNLLDDTMVFFGSGLGDAALHSNRNLPIVLAGGGLKHGEHRDCKRPSGEQTPLNNLFTTMLQNFGVETEGFNDATGTMSELVA